MIASLHPMSKLSNSQCKNNISRRDKRENWAWHGSDYADEDTRLGETKGQEEQEDIKEILETLVESVAI